MYVLESGDIIAQNRYEDLQRRFRKTGYDGRIVDRPENLYLCEEHILDMFLDSAPIFGRTIYEQMSFLGHRRSTTKKTLRNLKEKGILCLHISQYRLIDNSTNEPLELGAPIVFLAGTRSQKIGHIAEMRELKTGRGGIHPIAVLENGQSMFVSPQTAKVDRSQKTLDDCLEWLLDRLDTAVNKATAISAAEICRKAFEDEIPQPSNLIKIAVKSGKICRGYKRLARYSECVYWRDVCRPFQSHF